MSGILEHIDSPSDLKGLNMDELRQLCAELRAYIIEVCSQNPGHLASSLGAVELIVGWHYVFNAPKDKIVFDVGHQAYAHKILTGRRKAFASMRTENGISGFPCRGESPFDVFSVGHSSTAISAALGLAESARIQSLDDKIVALLGDGALTGGLSFEGLNNAGSSKADLLIMLNDNNQSIDGNKGALHNYLMSVTTSRSYNALKKRIWDILGDREFRSFIQRWVRSLKSWFVKKTGGDFFEALGFRYFGPLDGNDIEQVVNSLLKIQKLHGPRVIHFITCKGKGYAPAELDPVTWHAPGRFDPATGKRNIQSYPFDRYQDVFGAVLCELAESDKKVVGITPAMASGCGMSLMAEKFPAQFFDVGIEEEHAVTFSAGLAAGGMKPFCNIYSSFSQRAYDQIIHDVAMQKLPVVICLDRAGLVGEDGATHNGAFDIAAFRCIPNTIVSAPKDETELKQLMYTAYLHDSGPFIIRYPRGVGEGSDWKNTPMKSVPIGKADELLSGDEIAVITTGPVAYRALEAAADFPGKVGVYNFRFIKPLDCEMLTFIAGRYKAIITVEDAALTGGLYGSICEFLQSSEITIPVSGIGISDEFIRHARQSEQRSKAGIDTEGIRKRLKKYLENRK